MVYTSNATSARIKQLSLFLPNRVGALQKAVRLLEGERIRILAMSILEAADHAVVRMVVNRPAPARVVLADGGYPVFETDLLGVGLPRDEEFGMGRVLSALLVAEVNIRYVYSLIVHVDDCPVIALNVDDMEIAAQVLRKAGLAIVGQDDVGWTDL